MKLIKLDNGEYISTSAVVSIAIESNIESIQSTQPRATVIIRMLDGHISVIYCLHKIAAEYVAAELVQSINTLCE